MNRSDFAYCDTDYSVAGEGSHRLLIIFLFYLSGSTCPNLLSQLLRRELDGRIHVKSCFDDLT